MKRFGILFILFLMLSNHSFADYEIEKPFIGEWYLWSFIDDPYRQLSVELVENNIKCDGYTFYSRHEENSETLYVTSSHYNSPIKVNYIETVHNGLLLLYWLDDDGYCAYCLSNKANNSIVGYEVWCDNDKALFLENEIYLKSEIKNNDQRETEIEKMRYLHHENELFIIEDKDYEKLRIIEISDMYILLSTEDAVTYRNGNPVHQISVFLRTSAIK